MKKIGKILNLWIPPVLWCGLIFYFSSLPELKTPFGIWDFILRKLAHAVEFGILTLLMARALSNYFLIKSRWLFYAALFSLLFAISDEYHQTFVAGREGTIRDVFIDGVGIVLMILIIKRFKLFESSIA